MAKWPGWLGYVVTVPVEIAVTICLLLLQSYLPLGRYPIPYVLVIMLIAYLFGEGPAILAFFLGLLFFDYFFVPPLSTILPHPSTPTGLASVIAYILGTLIVGFATILMRRSRQRILKISDELRASERNYRAIFDAANDAIFVHDINTGDILDVSRKMTEMYGYTREEARRLKVGDLSAGEPPYTQADAVKWIREAAEGKPQLFEWKAKDKSEQLFWVEVNLKRAVIGGKDCLLAVVRDITERKQAEEALQKLNRTLRMLSQVNQVIIRAIDEPLLLKEVCQVIVDVGGYKMVWVGYAEYDPEKTVSPVAHAGDDRGYLDAIKVSWADTALGRGPTGTAIRTGTLAYTQDTAESAVYTPWRDEALARGYKSSIAIPLVVDNQPIGALSLYAGQIGGFDDEELHLLTELADDLAFGIASLRNRDERMRAVEALMEMEEHKRHFYRQTILAATGGKLEITECEEIDRIAGPTIASWRIQSKEDPGLIRHKVERIADAEGMDESSLQDFILCVGESTTNALKHAGSGVASLHHVSDSLMLVVSDNGPGIEAIALPEVALKRGYTTAASLGMGYKAIIHVAEKVYLATGPEGTTVGIEMKLHPVERPSEVVTLPDAWGS